MNDWTQPELERLFIRRDLYDSQRRDMQEDIKKLQETMEWFQRLIIAQGVILIVSIMMFLVERVVP